ncbi:MAG: hypothetical protein E6I10_02210 [Chloroflexi bacterium]|nr:MAG: hypothetical protein E6I10_02210 [Chloroflexota bacterium]
MRDGDGGAALHQPLQTTHHQCLGFLVEVARRLVHDHDGRVAQESPGNGDALFLPAGERRAALAHHRVEAFVEVIDEAGHAGRVGGRHDLAAGRIGASIGDVVPDRVAQQQAFLQYERDMRTEVGQREVAHIDAADQHAPGRHVIKARDERE